MKIIITFIVAFVLGSMITRIATLHELENNGTVYEMQNMPVPAEYKEVIG